MTENQPGAEFHLPAISQGFLNSLFHQSPNPLIILDMGKIVQLANPAAEKLLGRRMDELYNNPLSFACQAEETLEQQVVHSGGDVLICEVQTTRIELQGGDFLLVSLHDITASKELQHALQESEKRFRTLIDFTYDWEYWLSPEGDLLYVSNACKRITGYAAEDFLSAPALFEKIIHPEDRRRVAAHIAEEMEYYNLSSIDFRIVARNGRVRWINSKSRPLYDAQGVYLGRRASNRDITDRKKAEDKLLETEQRFRSFIEQSQDGMFLIDVDGKVIAWNHSQEEISGLKSSAVIERPFWEVRSEYIFYEDDTGLQGMPGKEKISAALKSGKGDWLEGLREIEMPPAAAVGEHTPVESRVIQEQYFPIKTDRGYQVGCIARDITEEKKAQRALQHLNLELEHRVADRTRQLTEENTGRKLAERQLNMRLENERILAEISAHFIRNNEFSSAVNGVLQLIGELSGAKRILLFRAQEYGDAFACTHVWQENRFTTRVKKTRVVSARSIPQWVNSLKVGHRVKIGRDNFSQLPPGFFPVETPDTQNVLLLPLIAHLQNREAPSPTGFLAMEEVSPRLEDEAEETGVLEIVAQMMSGAMERSQFMETLEQRVRDRTLELETLYEISAIASKPLGVEDILELSLNKIMSAMNSPAGFVHLLAEDGTTFYLARHKNIPPAALEAIQSMTWADSPLEWVFAHREPLLLPDMSAERRWPGSLYAQYPAYIGTPMRIKGRLLGVFSLLHESFEQLKLEQLTLLSTIADQLSAAVDSARLRDQAKETAVMEERHRLARELHDSITQYLYSLTLLTRGWQRKLESATMTDIAYWLERAGAISNQALKEMRLLLYNLRPLTLEQDGLVGALRRRLDAVEGRVEIKTMLHIDEDLALPARVEEELYGIAQEALNNILKHAEATRVSIHLRKQTAAVVLEINDNGNGFTPAGMDSDGSLGITSMRERAKNLGSALVIDSMPGKGTSVKVRVKI